MCPHACFFIVELVLSDSGLKFLLHFADLVTGLDTEAQRKHISQERIRGVFYSRAAASFQLEREFALYFKPVLKFLEQTRFTNASFTNHRDDLAQVVFEDRIVRVLQTFKFPIPSNHASGDAFHAASSGSEGFRLCGKNLVNLHRFFKSLRLDGRQRLNFKEASHMVIRGL